MQQPEETYTVTFDKEFFHMVIEGLTFLPYRSVCNQIKGLSELKSDQQLKAEKEAAKEQEQPLCAELEQRLDGLMTS